MGLGVGVFNAWVFWPLSLYFFFTCYKTISVPVYCFISRLNGFLTCCYAKDRLSLIKSPLYRNVFALEKLHVQLSFTPSILLVFNLVERYFFSYITTSLVSLEVYTYVLIYERVFVPSGHIGSCFKDFFFFIFIFVLLFVSFMGNSEIKAKFVTQFFWPTISRCIHRYLYGFYYLIYILQMSTPWSISNDDLDKWKVY